MKLQSRYLIKELMVPFLIGTVAVVLMFQINLLMAEFKSISVQHVPMVALAQLVLYKTPFFLQLTLPVGVSLASSLAFSRLTRDMELTAMRVAGSPILKAIMPVAIFGCLVGVTNFYVTEFVMPKSEKLFREQAIQVGIQAAAPEFASNVVIKLNNYVARIGGVSRGTDGSIQLTNIILFDNSSGSQESILTSPSGIFKDGIWHLKTPTIRTLKGDSLVVGSSTQDAIINERIKPQDLFLAPLPEEQSISEIRASILNARKLGQKTAGLEVALYNKFAFPATCVVFAFVAPIFAIMWGRSGGFVGVLLSIILVFLWINAFAVSTEILGRSGLINPIIACWLPNFLFGLAGLIGIRRLE